MKIYMIRHPAVETARNICYGVSDLKTKHCEDETVAAIKQKLPVDAIYYSSPLSRCMSFAKALTSKQVIANDDLLEINFGKWEMKSWDEIPREESQHWMNDYLNNSPPAGESFLNLINRSLRFWTDFVLKDTTDKVIVSHGGWVRACLVHLLHIDPYYCFRIRIDYLSTTIFEINDEEIHLLGLNT